MKKYLLVPVLALAALGPAHAETVDAVLADQQARGFTSTVAAVQRLQAAQDVPRNGASVKARQRYLRAVGLLAARGQARSMATVAEETVRELDALAARDRCRSCAVDARVVAALRALTRRDFDEADRQVARAARLASPADEDAAQLLHQVRARLLYMRGSFPQAIAEALPALEYADRHDDLPAQVALRSLLASVNGSLGDFPRALDNARQAYTLARAKDFRFGMAVARLGQGYIHLLAGQRERQREALEDALALGGDDPAYNETNVIVLANLADYWLSRENYRKALDYARRAEKLSRDYDDPRSLSYALANVGIAQFGLGEMDRGIATVRESVAMAAHLGAKNDEAGITEELIALHEKRGNFREALALTKRVAELNREITRNERDKAVLELQEKYDASSRQREIERLSAANRLKQAQMQAERWRSWLGGALALAFALSAALLVQWLKRARRENAALTGNVAALQEQSSVDPLTGAYNRRHADTLLTRLASGREPVAVALVDIDHFKSINDNFGHADGDAVLVEVAARLKLLLRSQDSVVRWGGEEFALILPGMRAEDLAAFSERVLKALASSPIQSGARSIAVTASLGSVMVDPVFEGRWQDALRVADLALYAAKADGRNRAISVLRLAPSVAADVGNLSFRTAATAGDLEYLRSEGPEPLSEPRAA